MSCDYEGEAPEFYYETRPLARKPYHCCECGENIEPGERYERVFAKWYFIGPTVERTCSRCLAIRDAVAAADCSFCWEHGNLRENVADFLVEEDYRFPELRADVDAILRET